MTEAMTELDAAIERGRVLLRDGKDFKALTDALSDDHPYAEAPKVPSLTGVTLTTEMAEALQDLLSVFGGTEIDRIRMLSPAEVLGLTREVLAIEAVSDHLTARVEEVKERIRYHLDLSAVADGRVTNDTVQDVHGHWIVARKGAPETVKVPDLDRSWSREYRSGSSKIDEGLLLEMYETGQITRDDYLALTVEKRVFDVDKAMRSMQKEPRLIEIINKIIKRGRPVLSLYLRK